MSDMMVRNGASKSASASESAAAGRASLWMRAYATGRFTGVVTVGSSSFKLRWTRLVERFQKSIGSMGWFLQDEPVDGFCVIGFACKHWHRWVYTPAEQHPPPSGALTVVHADAAFLVVDKPAYLTVENTVSNKDSVRSRLEAAGHARLHLAHRLDWETSGLLVVALDAAAASSLSQQFAGAALQRSTRRTASRRRPPRAARSTCRSPPTPSAARASASTRRRRASRPSRAGRWRPRCRAGAAACGWRRRRGAATSCACTCSRSAARSSATRCTARRGAGACTSTPPS